MPHTRRDQRGLDSAVGPGWANRWSDGLPINHLPGPSGGLTTGQEEQRLACSPSPLRKPLPPTLAPSLPGPPGSLNLPLVSQPPTLTKCLRTLLWSTRTRDYFSTEHTGLGLFWLEHNADLCQVLATSERGRRGEAPSAQPRKVLLTCPPRRGQVCSARQLCPQLCPQTSAVRPLAVSFLGPRKILLDTRKALEPSLPSLTLPAGWSGDNRLVRQRASGQFVVNDCI